MNGPGVTLEDLARRLGARIEGDPGRVVSRVAPLDSAGRTDLSFLANPRYAARARRSGAGAILAGPDADLPGRTLLIVEDPYLALARSLEILHPPAARVAGVSPVAIVGRDVELGADVTIDPGAVIGDGCRIGDGSRIMSGAVLGPGSSVGRFSVIHPNVTVYDRCEIGDETVIHAGTVIGSDGFGFARDGDRHHKIPQVGKVVVGDRVEIGANVTIDRATLGSTVIGNGTKIDNLVQVAHNVQIGENCLLVAQVGISGSTRIGDGVVFAGQSGAVGHIEIGKGARIGAKTAVTRSLPPGAFVVGHPAIEASVWKRAVAVFAKLPELRRRLLDLERRADPRDNDP